MADTRRQCPHCLRPRGYEGEAFCYAHHLDARAQDVRECLSLTIARLQAELAEARKPWWVGRTLLVERTVAVAAVFQRLGSDEWVWHRSEPAYAAIGGRGYATEDEAKAAAEAALGGKDG